LLAARALLAFQYRERNHDGNPTELAIDGSILHAEIHDIWRAFAKALLK
jgi:hypothetical protein